MNKMNALPTAQRSVRVAIGAAAASLLLIQSMVVVADPSSYAYTPTALVKYVHNEPHLDASLNSVNSTFALDLNSATAPQNDPYLESITTLPALIGAVCAICIIVFLISLCGRCCFRWCACAPDESEAGNTKEELLKWTAKYVKRREKYKACYIIAFVFVLLAVHIMHFGNAKLTDAATGTSDGLSYFQDSFQLLSDEGVNLFDYGVTVDSGLQTAQTTGCAIPPETQAYVDSYFQSVADYQAVVDPIPPKMEDLNNSLDLYAITYKNLSIWVFYGVVLFVLLIYIMAYLMKVRAVMGCASLLSFGLIWAILLLCVVEMIIVMATSDFCMDPRVNALELAPSGAVYDNLNYYSTCEGANPSEQYVDDAYYYVDLLNTTVYTLTSTTCSGNQALIDLYPTINDMYVSIDSINATLACPPIQEQWLGVLYDDICDTGFLGLYSMWVCQYGVFATMFCLLIAGSIVHNFFGAFWDVQLSMLDEHESKRKKVVDNVYNSFEDGGGLTYGSGDYSNPAYNAAVGSVSYDQGNTSFDNYMERQGSRLEQQHNDDSGSDGGNNDSHSDNEQNVPITKRKKLTPQQVEAREKATEERAARVRRGLPV